MGNSSKRDVAKIAAQEKRAKALKLRAAGHTFEQIAKMVGYSDRGRAYHEMQIAIADITKEPAAEVIEYEKMRLDALLLGIWPQATGGDLRAIDRVLKIMERRSSLLGLDAPKRTETSLSAQDGTGHVVQVLLTSADGQGSGGSDDE